jgi:hypothetical protein
LARCAKRSVVKSLQKVRVGEIFGSSSPMGATTCCVIEAVTILTLFAETPDFGTQRAMSGQASEI